jgi:hypothetical protein
MLKKLLAGLTTIVLALGIVTLVSAPAQAHTGDLFVTAQCNTTTKQYDLTVTLKVTNTTLAGSTMWDKGTETFTKTPTSNAGLTRGPVAIAAPKKSSDVVTTTLGTFSIDGKTTGLGPWVYAYTTWTDTYKYGSDGQLTTKLDGTCADTTDTKIDICHANNGSKGYSKVNVPYSEILGSNGHGTHTGDIIPPFDYVQGGVSKHYNGLNWTAGGQQIYNNGCSLPNAPPGPSYTEAVCTGTGTVGSATVTIPSGVTGAQYWIKSGTGAYATVAQGATPSFAAGTVVQVKVTPLAGYELSVAPNEFAAYTFSNVASKCVQPVAPTVAQAICNGPGTHSDAGYTITPTANVTYKVGGSTVTGSTKVTSFPTTVTVTAVIANGFTPVGTTSWTFTFADPGACLQDASVNVTFSNAVCTGPGASSDATYTLPAGNVTYAVLINGQPSSNNTAGRTWTVTPKNASITVTVTANPGYKLTSPATNTWTYNAPGACLVSVSVATAPTSVDNACIAGQAGGVTQATYTITKADHVTFQVSSNNVDFAPTSPATYNLAQGEQVWIKAFADNGYRLTGDAAWHFAATNRTDTCDFLATPAAPAWTDALCYRDKPGSSAPSYTVTAADHVHYQVSTDRGATWKDVATGVKITDVKVGDVVWIKPIADTGYKFGAGVGATSMHTFTDPGACTVTIPVKNVPTFEDAQCKANVAGGEKKARYTIPTSDHVTFEIFNGTKWVAKDADTYPLATGKTVQIRAIADDGYVLSGDTTWSFTAKDLGDSCLFTAKPATPTWTNAVCYPDRPGSNTPGYTVNAGEHVTYEVSTDQGQNWAPASVGAFVPVTVPATVWVRATADSGYKLPAGTDVAKHSFTSPGACTIVTTVKSIPTFADNACIAGQAGGVTTAHYTIPTSDHVSFQTWNGTAWVPIAAGGYDLAPGASVTIEPVADAGYVLTSDLSWTFTATDRGATCDLPATPATPTWTTAVCKKDVPGADSAFYTVNQADNVHYEVSLDEGTTWSPAVVGTPVPVDADATVWVRPLADAHYTLTTSVVFKNTFVAPQKCVVEASIAVNPTFTDAACVEGVAGGKTVAEWTLTSASNVTFEISSNGTDYVTTTDYGTHPLAAGAEVWLRAVPDTGFEISGTSSWDFKATDLAARCDFEATPVKPDVTAQSCVAGSDNRGVYTNGVIVIPATTGVQYSIDGDDVATGSHAVTPGVHTVVGSALSGYRLGEGYDGPWEIRSDYAPLCGELDTHPTVDPSVTSKQATCSASGSYTLSSDLDALTSDAVLWTVDGSTVAAGTYKVSGAKTITVVAKPNAPAGFGFDGTEQDQVRTWTLTFAAATACELKTLALTGTGSPVGWIGAGVLLLLGGLTLLTVQQLRRRGRHQQ